eukprot:2876157-Pleurochrysis_carterae.AAC.3
MKQLQPLRSEGSARIEHARTHPSSLCTLPFRRRAQASHFECVPPPSPPTPPTPLDSHPPSAPPMALEAACLSQDGLGFGVVLVAVLIAVALTAGTTFVALRGFKFRRSESLLSKKQKRDAMLEITSTMPEQRDEHERPDNALNANENQDENQDDK